VLAVVADSDPGAVYQQHRWLRAVVAASAGCAFVAMMGWATLRHGGLPVPVLLMVLALAGAPFLLPRGLFIPAIVLATAGSAAAFGLAHPPGTLDATRLLTGALAGAACALAVVQAVAVGVAGVPPKARVLSSKSKAAEPAPRVITRQHHARQRPGREPTFVPPSQSPPATPGGKDAAPAEAAPEAPAAAAPALAAPEESLGEPAPTPEAAAPLAAAPEEPVATAPEELGAPADDVFAAAEEFVRSHYAALDGRQHPRLRRRRRDDRRAHAPSGGSRRLRPHRGASLGRDVAPGPHGGGPARRGGERPQARRAGPLLSDL
jgi:hypothetical protein